MTSVLNANPGFPVSRSAKCWDAANIPWSISATPVKHFHDGVSIGEVTQNGVIYDNYTDAVTHDEWVLGINTAQLNGNFTAQIIEGVATLDPNTLFVAYNGADNYVTVRVDGPMGKLQVREWVAYNGSGPYLRFNRFPVGSFAKHSTDYFTTGMAGMVAANSTTRSLYSTYNYAARTFVRNVNCWTYIGGIDTTPISAASDYVAGVGKLAGILITPRHILQAGHAPFPLNTLVGWVDGTNTWHERRVTAYKNLLPGYTGYDSSYLGPGVQLDLCVGVLDQDLPGSVVPAQLMPANWLSYLPMLNQIGSYKGDSPPYFNTEQNKWALCADVYRDAVSGGVTFGNQISFQPAMTSPRSLFIKSPAIPGDSGNDGCFVLNGKLVVITNYARSNGSGASVASALTAITAMCNDTVPGYAPVVANLSAFTNYG